jgi:ketosteroid isomerase-like protein
VAREILGWNERGVDAIVESLDPAVEWHPPRESMEPGTYRGHDGVRDYFGRLREIFEDARVQLIDVLAVDEECRPRRRSRRRREHALRTDRHRVGRLLTMRDGKVTHVATFVDKHEARRVAGLQA